MLFSDAGIIRQPKWGHLKDLHKAIKLCEEALVATDPTITSPGPNLEVINKRLFELYTKGMNGFVLSLKIYCSNLRLQFTRQDLYAPPSLPTPARLMQRLPLTAIHITCLDGL
jgi:hypothetical protein